MASHITEPLATVDAKLFAVILLFSGQRSLLAIVGMSPLGRGCVKTCTGQECAELFSLLSSPDNSCQRCWFSN
jgi:hypothetical protein